MKNINIDDIIQQYYFDQELGLTSNAKVLQQRILQYENILIPQSQIKNVINRSQYNQVHQKINKELYIPITSPQYHYQCDLSFFEQYKSVNNNYIALMNIIDINTRYAYSYLIKSKQSDEIRQKLQEFIDQENNIVLIVFDSGFEFNNRIVKKLLDDNKIEYKFFNKKYSPNAIQVIERFNRTIRDLIQNYMINYKTNRYYDIIPDLIYNYNNRVHSSINLTPSYAKSINFIDYKKKREKQHVKELIEQQIDQDPTQNYLLQKKQKLFKKGHQNYKIKDHYIKDDDYNAFIMNNNQRVMPYQLQQKRPYIKNENEINDHIVDIGKYKQNKKQQRFFKYQ